MIKITIFEKSYLFEKNILKLSHPDSIYINKKSQQ